MRIVVTGATGNVGTAVLAALQADGRVDEIVGIARRKPERAEPGVRWEAADVVNDDLAPLFRGADAVIHLAWLIQPSRDERVTHAVNVLGSHRVFLAAAQAGVGALVHASSVGVYSPGPKDRLVDESWPREGIRSSFYSRHKATAERLLDAVERDSPALRVVRLRPGLIFQRSAASEIRRLFAGPLLPSPLVRPDLVPVVPSHPRLRVQAVHSDDVGEAYRLAALSPQARGAYNIAAEPVLDGPRLAELLGARAIRVPSAALRGLAAVTWMLRLQPTPHGWVDMGLGTPLLDASRARRELGWAPRRRADDALLELLDGLRDRAGADTPPLDPDAGGPLRVREFTTGVGGESG